MKSNVRSTSYKAVNQNDTHIPVVIFSGTIDKK